MKLRLLAMLLAALTLQASAKTYCIITGVSNYEGTESDLSASTDDAKRMAKFYRDMGASVRLLTGKHATSDNIIANIEKLSKISKPDDQIVFFFSGHGMSDSMVTFDMADRLYYNELFAALRKVKCTNIIVYIDACYSGTMYSTKDKDGVTEYLNTELEQNKGNNEKYIIFSSSRNDETSFELGSQGVFTKALLEGLSGAADADRNKEVTAMELFRYIYSGVKKDMFGRQHPNLITNIERNSGVVLSKVQDN